jgi:hypothetical protein
MDRGAAGIGHLPDIGQQGRRRKRTVHSDFRLQSGRSRLAAGRRRGLYFHP